MRTTFTPRIIILFTVQLCCYHSGHISTAHVSTPISSAALVLRTSSTIDPHTRSMPSSDRIFTRGTLKTRTSKVDPVLAALCPRPRHRFASPDHSISKSDLQSQSNTTAQIDSPPAERWTSDTTRCEDETMPEISKYASPHATM